MILPLTEADVDIFIVLDPKYYRRSVRPVAALLKIGMNFPGRVHSVPEEAIMQIAAPPRAGSRQPWLTSRCKREAAVRHD